MALVGTVIRDVEKESTDQENVNPEGNLLTGIPVLSPLAWQLSYRFPVHRIGPEFIPKEPGELPTSIIVYRDRKDEVGFMEINPVTKRLLELIDADKVESGQQLLKRIATEMSHPQPEVVVNSGLEILKGLAQKDIILGIKKQ